MEVVEVDADEYIAIYIDGSFLLFQEYDERTFIKQIVEVLGGTYRSVAVDYDWLDSIHWEIPEQLADVEIRERR